MQLDTETVKDKSIEFSKNLTMNLSRLSLRQLDDINIKSSDFNNKNKLKEIENSLAGNKNALVYVLHVESPNIANELKKFYHEEKKNKRFALSKWNENNTSPAVLYVGCSTTKFITRLKNHLGVTGRSTYSLHLSQWHKNLDYTLQVSLLEVKSTDDEVMKNFVVEVVEQQVWDDLKPIFGKRSGR